MLKEITTYINFRYPNWMDYARHQCRVNRLEGWAEDLMGDVIVDLLRKPEEKLEGLLQRTTKKLVNGQQTTELDKFVLKMIKINATSKFASFRKNTIGQKIITTGEVTEVASFAEMTPNIDIIDETTYNPDRLQNLDRMHTRNLHRLADAGYPEKIITLYREHYMESKPVTGKEKVTAEAIERFLVEKRETLKLGK